MRRALPFTLATTVGACAAAMALALSVPRDLRAQQDQNVFSATTQGVLVDVLVTDHGRPVAGLTSADFEVRDNGILQRVEALRIADQPINTVLALDTSRSTAGSRLRDLKSASHAMLDGLRAADRASVTSFGSAVSLPVAATSDLLAVRRAIDQLLPLGDTFLFDGTYAALASTLQESGRSLVVVCTDGRDTMSWLDPEEVLESARRTNAVVYVVASGTARRWGPLKDLTDATGGALIELTSNADLRPQFQRILDEFRSRYVLTYTPVGVTTAGFHRLDVRVKRGGLTVRARPGYIGGIR